jgi:hypothetical protein
MHTAICAFGDRERARQAVDALVSAGFARDDIHVEHKQATAKGGSDIATSWDGDQREIHDRGVLSSFGHFFASLLGRDNPSGQVDTYARHVERGGCVVVVDADSEADAKRARTLLQQMQGGDLNVVNRVDRRRLRDIVALPDEPAGMMERSREAQEGWSGSREIARERAMASHRLDAIGGPSLRDPDLTHPPGLRYADKDKPNE